MNQFLCLLFLSFFALSPSRAATSELRLALNWKPEPQFGGFYAAEEHFKTVNLKVKLLPGGSGTPTVQMLAAGQAEYAIVSADELILAHDRGAKDLVALFAAFQTNPQALMFRESKKYQSIQDLLKDKNSTLLWQSGLPYALFLQKKFGRPLAKTAPYSGGISAMLADENINQQCFVTSEPLTAKKNNLAVKTFLIAEAGYNPYTTVLVTTKKRLGTDPDEVQNLTLAVQKGWADYLQSHEATNKKMNRLNPSMDVATMNSSALAQRELIQTPEAKSAGLGVMTLERWQSLIDQLADLKLIKAKPAAAELFKGLSTAPLTEKPANR